MLKKCNKNRFKSIVSTDRYGITYTKNFIIFADGQCSLQRFDSTNTRIRHINIERIRIKKYGRQMDFV